MQNSEMIWEQTEKETDYEFELFCIYRALQPEERNTIKTWEVYSEREENVSKRYNKDLEKIADKNDWFERAIAFDQYSETTLIEYARSSQYKELLSFKKRQRELSRRLNEISLGLIKLAQQRLLKIKSEEISVSLLPKYIQMAVMVANMTSDNEASVLMLDDLARVMQGELNEQKPEQEQEDLSLWQDQ